MSSLIDKEPYPVTALENALRKLYAEPKLEELGDLRSMTLGPSIGAPQDSPGSFPADTWN